MHVRTYIKSKILDFLFIFFFITSRNSGIPSSEDFQVSDSDFHAMRYISIFNNFFFFIYRYGIDAETGPVDTG